MPWPADYGGVIDVFYKLKALREQGVGITLHTFHYGRERVKELEAICDRVHYYKRLTGWRGLSWTKPYIISSRRSKALLYNLQADDAPILFEGLHCCYYLDHPAVQNRFKAVRLHNIEWQYYRFLAERERHVSIRSYLKSASRRLKKFEKRLSHAQLLLPISPNDHAYYSALHGNVHYLPAFHGNSAVTSQAGRGDYVLYHGNLSVNENHEAAMWLLKEVWQVTPMRGEGVAGPAFPLIIAGRQPRRELLEAAKRHAHVTVEANPGAERMTKLIADAHVHALPTFQSSGIKLKLLNTLFGGRFVVANQTMVDGTGLEFLCAVVNEPTEFRRQISTCMGQAFDAARIEERRRGLSGFENAGNAKSLLDLMGP